MESGQTQLEARPFDLQALLEEVVDYFEWEARKRGIDLWLDADARLPAELLGDPQRLKQVLLNLLGNGLKFTEEGQVVLECRPLVPSSQGYRSDRLGWADVFQAGSQVSMPVGDGRLALFFAVHDTGIGVADEKKSVIFTSFAQGDPSSSRKYGGTGLGLTLARKLIDLMGGQLDLQSRANQGSSFFFTLSLHLSRKPQNHPHPAPPTGLGWMGPSEIQPRLQSLLEQAGYAWSHPAKKGLSGILCWAGRAHYRGTLPCITLVANHMHHEGAAGVPCLRMPFTARRLRSAIAAWSQAGAAQAGAAQAGTSAGPAELGSERARLNLLLAEDNPISQKLLLRLLAERGVLAEAVSTGVAVLEAVGGREWDAILMDIQMPEMDGVEASLRLRERGYSPEELPIIALTAHDLPEERRRCRRAGMTGFLVKPLQLEELDALLASLARGKA
jgi:CheY-like chemotaxis protein